MKRLDADDTFGRLTCCQSFLRPFKSVIYSVSKQVPEGSIKPFENVTVDLSCFTANFQPHFFAKGATNVAHHARKPENAVCKRSHTTCQRLIVEPMSKVARMTI